MGLQHSLVASNLTYGDAKTPLPPSSIETIFGWFLLFHFP